MTNQTNLPPKSGITRKETASHREAVLNYALSQYQTSPEYPWADTPDAAVLRHSGTRKWYGLIMKVDRSRLGLAGEGASDILNVKCEPEMGLSLRTVPGILPAYHMNKVHWISVLLDGTVKRAVILSLLDQSFALTERKSRG